MADELFLGSINYEYYIVWDLNKHKTDEWKIMPCVIGQFWSVLVRYRDKQAHRCHIKSLPIEESLEWDFDSNLNLVKKKKQKEKHACVQNVCFPP